MVLATSNETIFLHLHNEICKIGSEENEFSTLAFYIRPTFRLDLAVTSCFWLKFFISKIVGAGTTPISSTTSLGSGVLAGGQGGQLPPLRVKYEGRQNGNPKHMGAEGALAAVLVK